MTPGRDRDLGTVALALRLDRETARVVRALEAGGVASLLLKGPAIQQWLYEHEHRPYSDIDLLVQAEDQPRALSVLHSLGYSDPFPGMVEGETSLHARTLKRDDGLVVDLHTRLNNTRASDSEVWEVLNRESKTRLVAGAPVRVPSPVPHAVVIVLHASQHGRHEHKPREDVERLSRVLTDEALLEAAQLADRLGAKQSFVAGLSMAPSTSDLARRLGGDLDVVVRVQAQGLHAEPGVLRLAEIAEAPLLRRLGLVARALWPTEDFLRTRTSPREQAQGAWLIRARLRRLSYQVKNLRRARALLASVESAELPRLRERSEPLRLTVVAGEFPFPANHGGRVDMWRRLVALHEEGVSLQLVCWYSDRWGGAPEPAHLQAVREVVDDLVVLKISQGPGSAVRRLLNLYRWPSHATARVPAPDEWAAIYERVDSFEPEGVWLDNIWGSVVARRLAERLRVPYWVRSHNVEAQYMWGQMRRASARARMRLLPAVIGLRRYELRVLSDAAAVYEISPSGVEHWKSSGVRSAFWLPPLAQGRALTNPPAGDVVTFVGNLHTPNNVQGLQWLVEQVWPAVRARRSAATLVVAGSSPDSVVLALGEQPGVRVVPDPADTQPLYEDAAVLINPVQFSSGVNIKSVEMLATARPVVSTSAGVAGLPPDVAEQFMVADDPELFAQLVVRALESGSVPHTDVSSVVERHFGRQRVRALLTDLQISVR